jgi:hypothetical protein
LFEIFLILRRIQRDIIVNVLGGSCRVAVIVGRLELNFGVQRREGGKWGVMGRVYRGGEVVRREGYMWVVKW